MSLNEFKATFGPKATLNEKEKFVKLLALIEKAANGRDFNPIEATALVRSVFAQISHELDANQNFAVAHLGKFKRRKLPVTGNVVTIFKPLNAGARVRKESDD